MPPNGGNFSGPKYIEAYNAQRWFEPRVREIQWWLQREAFNFKIVLDKYTLWCYSKPMTLKEFIKSVDIEIGAELGVSVHDLPDIDWYVYYDSDLSSKELGAMVQDAVSDIKYDNGFAGMSLH